RAALLSWWQTSPSSFVLLLVLVLLLRREIDLLDRLQVIEHLLRLLAPDLRVPVQREAVRSLGVDELRLQGQASLDVVELAHHRGAENVDAGALAEEERGDFTIAHVRSAAEA